jgi:hypothetical protein
LAGTLELLAYKSVDSLLLLLKDVGTPDAENELTPLGDFLQHCQLISE